MVFAPMNLAETVPLMNGSDFKDRFRAEYFQLSIRLGKLEEMLRKMKAGTLPFTPSCSYELLHEQAVYMKQYKRILEQRAEIENIDWDSND
jgi:hypothetical protein